MKIYNKIYVIAAILGLTALILVVFFIYPLFNQVKDNSRELTVTKEEIASLGFQTKRLENFRENYKNLQPNLAKADQLFIDPKNPIGFIQFLEKAAYDNNLLIVISIPLSSKKELIKGVWPSLNFQVSLTGSFPNFLKFLDKIAYSSYLIENETLNIKRLNEGDLKLTDKASLGDINTSLLMKVFTK